jgi:AcrR family transcriptional regulator
MGINRPSLYAAFGNKEQLFRKALDTLYTSQANSTRPRILEISTKTGCRVGGWVRATGFQFNVVNP